MKTHPFPFLALAALIPAATFADDGPYIQYLPQYMPQSPAAQAVARAIEIPVNHYTGIPDISIPLYTIQVGQISVPIMLSYHGGGIKPGEEATSVGLGWSLSSGGMITRTVKCADDFMEYKPSDSQFTCGFLGRSEWPDLTKSPDYNYYRRVSAGGGIADGIWSYYLYVDSEPDLFFYSIPGYSGRFSFMKDTTIVCFDKSQNVRITPSFGTDPRPYFYIIDSKGIAYSFEKKERTHVFSAQGMKNVNTTAEGVDVDFPISASGFKEVQDYTSAWYLTQITSPCNDTVDFEYAGEEYGLPVQESCRYQTRISGKGENNDADGPIYSMSKTQVQGKRITKIKWRGGHVAFKYGKVREDLKTVTGMEDNTCPLTNIYIYNEDSLLVGSWRMSYSYFNGDMTGIPEYKQHLFKRLRLDSVTNMLDSQDPYRFNYYNTVSMPVKNTKNVDCWGYYNGVVQGDNYYCHKGNYSRKKPDIRYGKIGILESFSLPAGGTVNLDWEQNKAGESIEINNAWQSDLQNITSCDGEPRGGLRIRRIEGERKITYLYGGGKDLVTPCRLYQEEHITNNGTTTFEVQPSESVRPFSSTNGGNFGYSKVTEIMADNTRTEYTFHNETEEMMDENFPYSPTYTDWSNGKQLSKTTFDETGDTVVAFSKTYEPIVTQNMYQVGFIEIRPGNVLYYYNDVKYPTVHASLKKEYRDNGIYRVYHSYTYNDDLLCSSETRRSGTDIQKSVYHYPGDFTDGVSNLMVSSNIVGIPVAIQNLRNGNVYGGARNMYGNFNEITDNGNTVVCGSRTWSDAKFREMYQPKVLLGLNTDNAPTDISGCSFDTVATFNSYTKYGKAREMTVRDMPVTYLWAYKGVYPVAEVKNSTYSQFKNSYGNTNVVVDKEDPGMLMDRIRAAADRLPTTSTSICLYKPLVGVSRMSDARGVVSSYSYDKAGRLQNAKYIDMVSMSPEQTATFTYGRNVVTSNIFRTTNANNGIGSIQYYDIWGRPYMKASQGSAQDGSYSYSMQTYDSLGRDSRSYLPVPGGTTGGLMNPDEYVQSSSTAFAGDAYGYSQTCCDAAGRPVKTTTPGKSWHDAGKSATVKYLTNTAGEVRRYTVSGNSLAESGYYDAGTLDCTQTTDPDGLTMKTYKDVFGNVVLERRAEDYDTYFVYDNLNRLRFVLPPKYQSEKNLGYYAYQYEYDGKGRMTKKTLPGCEPVRYWYDHAGRPVKMQDGELAKAGLYRVWSYDGLGRQVSQAIGQNGNIQYYETLNFYDNYGFISGYQSLVPGNAISSIPYNVFTGRGQLTGAVRMATNGERILTVLGYDGMGYLSNKTETGPGGLMSVSNYTNNLAGDITEECFEIYKTGNDGVLVKTISGSAYYNYDYPHTGLLSSTVMTITDSQGKVRTDTIQSLSYDNFGYVTRNHRSGANADMTYE